MEKNPLEKSESFSRNGNGDGNENGKDKDRKGHDEARGPELETRVDAMPEGEEQHQDQEQQPGESDEKTQPSSDPELTLPQALEEVDRLLEALSEREDKSSAPEVPSSVGSLLKMTEEIISNYDDSKAKFGQNHKEDSSFTELLSRIPKIIEVLREFTSDSTIDSCINRASIVLHQAGSFLEDEFRLILETRNATKNSSSSNSNKDTKSQDHKSKQASSSSNSHQESDRCVSSENPESNQEKQYPAYSPEVISNMKRIATTMISSGFQKECSLIYSMMRRVELNAEVDKLGFDNISIEEVQKMQWESLEGEITTWINVIKHCSSVLLAGERKLCIAVFPDHPSLSESIFSDLALTVTLRFLNFAEGIALTKRSTERLFKFLDMYETVRDLIPGIENADSSETALELKSEIWAAKCRLGEAAVNMFCDLENSIRRDKGRNPVPTGAVHPLTRYTMNYLKYASEYRDTLEQVFQQQQRAEGSGQSNEQEAEASGESNHRGRNEDGTPQISRFSVQMNTVMNLLHENLDMKSKMYKDPSLRYIFLMNNGRYILQKIKGSNEIHDTMGVTWYRKQSSDLRIYHKGYTRETWSKLLQVLSHEGLQMNGKVQKPVLKDRFKAFNTMLDEIHRTQRTWVVCDEQLQSELRVSISALVIPAYRSFLGRFQQNFKPGRQTEKYIKYQPEDVENLIDQLFDGNRHSMGKRKTKFDPKQSVE